MALSICPKCHRMHYNTDPCIAGAIAKPAADPAPAPDKAKPKRKPGRPRTGFDKRAYQRELMRKRRAAARAKVGASKRGGKHD